MRTTVPVGATVCFLAAEGCLYAAFLSLDLAGGHPAGNWLKFGGILLCFIMALFSALWGGDRLVAAALGLTAAADVFLLLLDRHYAVGVLIFLGVQGLYLLRLARADGRSLWLPRASVAAVLLAVLWALGQLTPLNALAAVYFSALLCNAVHSFLVPASWARIFGAGLALFACCDACVGAFNSMALLPQGVYPFVRVGMWLFYLPAQVLIVCSGFPGRGENEP